MYITSTTEYKILEVIKMLKKYVLSKHSIERYEERTNKTKQPIVNRMLRDLYATRNKKLVSIGKNLYIFYTQPNTNVREFIIEKRKDIYFVTTVINRNKQESDLAYKNRLRQKKEFENKKK